MQNEKETYWLSASKLALQCGDSLLSLTVDELLQKFPQDTALAQANQFDVSLNIIETLKGEEKGEFDEVFYTVLPFIWTNLLIASSNKGICFLGFVESDNFDFLKELRANFPKSLLINRVEPLHEKFVEALLKGSKQNITLHLTGTAFQFRALRELLKLSPTEFITYKELSTRLGTAKAYRAAGTAIGRNALSLLIPCHQIIGSDGKLRGYRWGLHHKLTLLIGQLGLHE